VIFAFIDSQCNIGDHAIFLDLNGGFAIKANDLAGIKANCIYLLKPAFYRVARKYINVVERINIETGASEELPCPLERPGGWFIPSLHHV
jgi:Protein of unknown function (DUF295)